MSVPTESGVFVTEAQYAELNEAANATNAPSAERYASDGFRFGIALARLAITAPDGSPATQIVFEVIDDVDEAYELDFKIVEGDAPDLATMLERIIEHGDQALDVPTIQLPFDQVLLTNAEVLAERPEITTKGILDTGLDGWLSWKLAHDQGLYCYVDIGGQRQEFVDIDRKFLKQAGIDLGDYGALAR